MTNKVDLLAYEQLRAGLGLLASSKLVNIDASHFALTSAIEPAFEVAARELDPEYGRVARWIMFAAGVEYLLKGVSILRNLLAPQEKLRLRPPAEHESIAQWVTLVTADDPAVKERVPYLGTLGNVPFKELTEDLTDRELARSAFELFRASIRNRDAHYYAKSVRAAHFRVIPDLLVPALNAVLATVANRSEMTQAFAPFSASVVE